MNCSNLHYSCTACTVSSRIFPREDMMPIDAQQPGHDSMPIRSLLLSYEDHRWFDGCFEKMAQQFEESHINITSVYHQRRGATTFSTWHSIESSTVLTLQPWAHWNCTCQNVCLVTTRLMDDWWMDMDAVPAFCTKRLSSFLTNHQKCHKVVTNHQVVSFCSWHPIFLAILSHVCSSHVLGFAISGAVTTSVGTVFQVQRQTQFYPSALYPLVN